jgi:hypothetical protein
MTDERLLARLRGRGNKDTIAAADRIEALTAERDALIVGRDMLGRWWEKEKARAEKAEAKLKEAVEGLREIAGECGCSTARAIIAEIEGSNAP